MANDPTDLTAYPVGTDSFVPAPRNASDFDKLINGGSVSVTNRAGQSLKSWQKAVDNAISKFGGLNNRGLWSTPNTYSTNDLWQSNIDGTWYIVVSTYTAGATESDDISSGNVRVYQGLNGSTGIAKVNSISEVSSLSLTDGQRVSISGYHEGSLLGGGDFIAGMGVHNGGTVISLTRSFPTDWSDQSQLEAWFDSSGVEELCLNRIYGGMVNVMWFGAKGDGTTIDTKPIAAASLSLSDAFGQDYYFASITNNQAAELYFPRGLFNIDEEIPIPRGIRVSGENARNHGGTTIYNSDSVNDSYCFNLFYQFDSLSGPQFIADQQIQGFMFRNAKGGGVRANIPAEIPSGHFYSTGSLSFDQCFFLGMTSDANSLTPSCGIWVDGGIERVTNCTFDAGAYCGIRTNFIGSTSGNMFFSLSFGGVVLDGSDSIIQSNLGGCVFYNCGDSSVAAGAFPAAVGLNTLDGVTVKNANLCGATFSGSNGGFLGVYAPEGGENITIGDIKFKGLNGDAIRLIDCSDIKLNDLDFVDCGNSADGVYTVGLFNCSDVKVNGLDFKECGALKNLRVDSSCDNILLDNVTQDVDSVEILSSSVVMVNSRSGVLDKVSVNFSATNWQSTTYLNGWTDAAETLKFRRDELGRVILEGGLNVGSNQVLVLNLPAGFRPRDQKRFMVVSQSDTIGVLPDKFANITITTNGDLYIAFVTGSDVVYFDGLSFTAWS